MELDQIRKLLIKPADLGFLLNVPLKKAKGIVAHGFNKAGLGAKNWEEFNDRFRYDGIPLAELQSLLPYELDNIVLDINKNYLKRHVSRAFILNYFEGVEKKRFIGKVRPLTKFLESGDCEKIIENWSYKHKCLMDQMEIEGRREVKKRHRRV